MSPTTMDLAPLPARAKTVALDVLRPSLLGLVAGFVHDHVLNHVANLPATYLATRYIHADQSVAVGLDQPVEREVDIPLSTSMATARHCRRRGPVLTG